MTPAWAQRREEMLSDCLVSPDVFTQMVDRLGEFIVPYQQALETEADQHPMHLYLQGLLSHLPRKNAEAIATLVDVERLVMQLTFRIPFRTFEAILEEPPVEGGVGAIDRRFHAL